MSNKQYTFDYGKHEVVNHETQPLFTTNTLHIRIQEIQKFANAEKGTIDACALKADILKQVDKAGIILEQTEVRYTPSAKDLVCSKGERDMFVRFLRQ